MNSAPALGTQLLHSFHLKAVPACEQSIIVAPIEHHSEKISNAVMSQPSCNVEKGWLGAVEIGRRGRWTVEYRVVVAVAVAVAAKG